MSQNDRLRLLNPCIMVYNNNSAIKSTDARATYKTLNDVYTQNDLEMPHEILEFMTSGILKSVASMYT